METHDWNENKAARRPLKMAYNGYAYFHIFHGISGEVPVYSSYSAKLITNSIFG